jgi:tetratricopeptide (TPR) repeat protein
MVRLVVALIGLAGASVLPATAGEPPAATGVVPSGPLEDAQRSFYNGHYESAASLALAACGGEGGAQCLTACEVRTSALLFQIKRALKGAPDKRKALARCSTCPDLIAAFDAALQKGQALARAQLQIDPGDETALFLLGKLNLNHVWLQLGTLGRRTGWGEYSEARKILEQVLEQNPQNVRARVAHAWIDYIVATKMPRGTRWILGGGNKKRGLRGVQQAADMDAPFFDRTEALFALWDMQVRERQIPKALETARRLAQDFPANEELRRFIETHEVGTRVSN